MKFCSKCGAEKDFRSFYAHGQTKDRLGIVCKDCYKKDYARRYRSNPLYREQHKKKVQAWRKKNPEKCRKHVLEYRSRNPGYGLTPAEFESLLQKQKSVCAICGLPCSSGHRLSVDHCHNTGKLRGLLCRKCNLALGALKDSTELFQKAIDYLNLHQKEKAIQ